MTPLTSPAAALNPPDDQDLQDHKDAEARDEQRRRSKWVVSTFMGALGAGCVSILVFALSRPHPSHVVALGLLVAGASALIGGLLGFLFGLPREGAAPAPPAPAPASGDGKPPADNKPAPAAPARADTDGVNNNLLEISDWLTKIIIGAGLVGLKELVPWLGGVAEMVGYGAGLADRPLARVFGGSILAFFGAWGFLFVYIQTRTIISLIFATMQRSLRDALGTEVRQAVKAVVRETVMPQIESSVSENALLARLYSSDAGAAEEVVTRAQQFLSQPGNSGNGRVWLYLACAYGQLHAATPEDNTQVRKSIADKAFIALTKAIQADSSLRTTARGLMFDDDAAHLPGDDDLKSFAVEERFRTLVGR